jgi:hypothetical protein
VSGFTIGVKGYASIVKKMNVFGKAGLLMWESDGFFSGTIVENGISYLGSVSAKLDDGTGLYFGFGFDYVLTDMINVDFSFIRYLFDVDLDVGIDSDGYWNLL